MTKFAMFSEFCCYRYNDGTSTCFVGGCSYSVNKTKVCNSNFCPPWSKIDEPVTALETALEQARGELKECRKEWHHWKATSSSDELKDHFMELEIENAELKERVEALRHNGKMLLDRLGKYERIVVEAR